MQSTNFSFEFHSFIRNFDFVESTIARKCSNYIWHFARLFVPLTSSKVLSLENAQIIFGILLAYSYL